MSIKTRTVTFSLKQDVTALVEQYSRYAWILHDMDVDTDTGEIKDPHYHYYIEFPNQRYLSSVSKEFNIDENMIEVVRNKKGILKYLTHSTESSKNKYQYDVGLVHSSFDVTVASEDYTMLDIYNIIRTSSTLSECISRIQSTGYSGNPLNGLGYIVNLWRVLCDDTLVSR